MHEWERGESRRSAPLTFCSRFCTPLLFLCSSMLLCECAFMRTTIDLPDPLFRAAKMRAVERGTTLKQLVAGFIEAGLRGPSVPLPADRRQRPPLPAAIVPDPAAGQERAKGA